MKKELQDKLYEKYPKLYIQRHAGMQQSAMCWGFSCGSGWYNIIDNLSATIQNRVDYLNGEGQHKYRELPEDHVKVVCEAVQVKEKFGGLCFYIYGDDDEFINGAIDLAENLSYKTCEICGAPGATNDSGWRKTRCDNCQDKTWRDDV